MLDINILDLIPPELRQQIRDALVDFVFDQANKVLGYEVAANVKKLRSDASFQKNFETGLQKAVQRFIREYESTDEDLVAAIAMDNDFFNDGEVRAALLVMLKNPGSHLVEEKALLMQSFSSVLPGRKNRDRVNQAVSYLLRCLAEELWHLPELQPIYSLQFQRLTAETVREQLEIQRAQLCSLADLNTSVREVLLQLTDSIGAQKLLMTTTTETFSSQPRVRNNLPQPDYKHFIGREGELARIHQVLRPYPHSQEHLTVIDGVGGVGKSALALEAAYRYLNYYDLIPIEERFDAIVWTSAKQAVLTSDGILPRPQSLRTLDSICTTIGITLQREDINRARVDERIEVVRNALTRQRTLLIVDNLEAVDDENVITFLRELPAPTKAIVTTRIRIDVAYPIRLVGMPWDDAQKLIAQECAKNAVTLSPGQSLRLYDRTGGVPLAIVWSIARMGLGYGVDTVLARLGKPASEIARYCFEETFRYISQRDSYRMLIALAVIQGATSREMLGALAGFGEDSVSRDEALVELERLSLVSRHNGQWGLSPLVKQYVLEMCAPELKREYLTRAVNEYCRFVREQVGDERIRVASYLSYTALEAERSNIFGLVDWCHESGLWETVLELILGMGYFPHARGYWQDAIRCWEIGANAAQMVDNQPMYARCITYLGYMYFFQGNYAGAQEYVRRAERTVDKSTPSYQLASIRRLQGQLAGACENNQVARELLNESLQMMRHINNAQGVAKVLNDLGELANKTGDYESAELYLTESLSMSEVNADLTELTRGLRHMGELALLTCRYDDSKSYYNRSLSAARGAGWHDEVGQAMYGLARLEWRCGNPELARALALDALQVFEAIGQTVKGEEIQRTLADWENGT